MDPYSTDQSAYGYGYPPGLEIDHPRGVLILVFGLLSVLGISVLGPFAWVMGTSALAEIDGSPTRYRNRQLVEIGRILGIVGTVMLLLVVAMFVVMFVVFGLSFWAFSGS